MNTEVSIMSSRSAAKTQRFVPPQPHPGAVHKAARPAVRLAQGAPGTEQRATSAATRPVFAILGDPLWGMAIASGILFAALAALVAFA
jgi:hypothetical protein